jgi:hypothetical protein
LVGVLGLSLAAVPQDARADLDLQISFDANGVVGLRDTNDHGVNIGLAGRLGLGFDTGVVRITPEGMFEWDRFGDNDHVIRVLGGLRISGGRVFEPSVFGHAGWGRRNFRDVRDNEIHDDGFAVDAGAALDFTAIPFLKIGAQAAYNLVELEKVFDFVTFGGHLTLLF